MSAFSFATALLFVVWLTGLVVIPFWYVLIPLIIWVMLVILAVLFKMAGRD